MKKLLTLLVLIIITFACERDEFKKERNLYNDIVKDLEQISESSFLNYLPFDLSIYTNKLNDNEIIYEVIIDNPKEEIKDLTVLVVHNYDTNDPYPNIGIFDDKVNMKPNYIDSNYIEGIKLVGYIPFKKPVSFFNGEFRLFIEYNDELDNKNIIYYKYQS